MLRVLLVLLLLTLLTSCKVKQQQPEPRESEFLSIENTARLEFLATQKTVLGTIVDHEGVGISGVTISSGEITGYTDEHGHFSLLNVPPQNYQLSLAKIGYKTHFIQISTYQKNQEISLSPISIERVDNNEIDLIFGGDVAFGRRFLDPSLKTMSNFIPADNPDALIRATTASNDAKNVLKYVRPLFSVGDFSSVNFESPVTNNPVTPHPTKDFNFFSLPGTIEALPWTGIDYVGLGNNHIFDYMESGLDDTLAYFNQAEMPNSGAGVNIEEAYAPYVATIKNKQIAMIAATSITGNQHQFNYVASHEKGGAADLTNTPELIKALSQTTENYPIVIAQYHGGDEYTYKPSPYISSRFDLTSNYPVSLIVSHHPHIAQGFGKRGEVPVIYGLGNLAFDQDRLETMLGVIARVNLRGESITKANAYPVYLEDYRPRFVTGELSDYLSRRLAEFSDQELKLSSSYGHMLVDWQTPAQPDDNISQQITVTPDANGKAIIDLRKYKKSNQYVSNVQAPSSTTIKYGRDIMIYGDFEDWDVDEDVLEASRWDLTSLSNFLCVSQAFRGVQAVCSIRFSDQGVQNVIPFRNTIRVMDYNDQIFKDLTLWGYAKGQNAGNFSVRVFYVTEMDDLEFGQEDISLLEAGTYGWQAFKTDLNVPDDSNTLGEDNLPPRGIKLRFLHNPPENSGEGLFSMDDVAVISWERTFNAASLHQLSANGFDFIQLTGLNETTQISIKLSNL